MSERPILFSGPMVRAILDGRKSVTRRVVAPNPWNVWGQGVHTTGKWAGRYMLHARSELGDRWHACPFGAPGDLLWVRETWAQVPWSDGDGNDTTKVLYRATDPHSGNWRPEEGDRWRPSIHMPKWAARIWLRVTDVRVERLQEITEEDARAEGVTPIACEPASIAFGTWKTRHRFRDAFHELWDSLNESRGYGWDANPFVWVIAFERVLG